MSKNNSKKKIKKVAQRQEEAARGEDKSSVILSAVEKTAMSVVGKDDQDQPFVALKYYNHHHECLSEWTAEELKAFSDFNDKVRSQSWKDIFASGGKPGDKKGLGYTLLKASVIDKLPHQPTLKKISKDISFFELRVTKKARAIGFRIKAIFFLVWLDREHDACA